MIDILFTAEGIRSQKPTDLPCCFRYHLTFSTPLEVTRTIYHSGLQAISCITRNIKKHLFNERLPYHFERNLSRACLCGLAQPITALRKITRLLPGKLSLSILFIFLFSYSRACQCPLTQLSLEECNKYEIIFKGKILSAVTCDLKFGEAVFEIEELYKGNATKQFKVLFDCNEECFQKFTVGDEWIIYSRYKQIDNAKMDWCSRSRKFFKIDKEDFYTYTYGNDYYDEVKFLQEKLGVHRVLADKKNMEDNRNIKPNGTQMLVILLCSLTAIILFYYLFNKFFR